MISFVIAIFLLLSAHLVSSADLLLLKSKDGLLVSRKYLRSKVSQADQLDGKYTGEPCEFGSSTCVFPRECRYWSDTPCSADSTTCECYIPDDDQLCSTSAECQQRDRCYENPWDASYESRCVTCEFNLVPPTSFDRLKPVDEGTTCISETSTATTPSSSPPKMPSSTPSSIPSVTSSPLPPTTTPETPETTLTSESSPSSTPTALLTEGPSDVTTALSSPDTSSASVSTMIPEGPEGALNPSQTITSTFSNNGGNSQNSETSTSSVPVLNSSPDATERNGLSSGIIAGISVAGAILLIVIMFMIFRFVRK